MAPGSVVKKVAISKKGFFNIFYELDPVCLIFYLRFSLFFFFFLVYLPAGTVIFKFVCIIMNANFQNLEPLISYLLIQRQQWKHEHSVFKYV